MKIRCKKTGKIYDIHVPKALHINSALVSAQNRKRVYFTNIGTEQVGFFGDLECTIPQPKDKGILLKDILETEVADKYFLSEKMVDFLKHRITKTNKKSSCFTAGGNSGGLHSQMDLVVHNTISQIAETSNNIECIIQRPRGKNKGGIFYKKSPTITSNSFDQNNIVKCAAMRGRNPDNPKSRIVGLLTEQQLEQRNDGKTNCLTSVQKDNLVISGTLRTHNDGKGFREVTSGKGATIPARAREDGSGQNVVSVQGNIRRLTPIECERLQTVPDCFTEFCMSIDYLYICNETNVIKKWLQSAELKSAIQILQTKKQDYVTSIIYDLSELEQLKERLLIEQKNANTKNATIINKLLKDIVLLTTKDLSNTAHQNCLSKLFKEIKNANIAINPLEKMEEEQEECVIDITKTGLDTKTLYTRIINAMKLNQEGTMVELTVRNDTGLLWKFQSDEILNVAKLYITLTLIKKIIQSKIYTYSKIKMNIKSAISNLNILERNYLSVELLDLRTENISLNSDTQRYKMLGNGWTIDVIAYILNYLKKE